MMRFFFLLLTVCFLTGCGPRYVDYFPFYDDGRPKPKVALLPIMNKVSDCVPWDFSEEIQQGVHYQAMCGGQLFLLSENEVLKRLQSSPKFDYFAIDYSFAKCFSNCDYLVALEAVEHQVIPYRKAKGLPSIPLQKYRWHSVLSMKLRLRILDVRCEQPRLVLQEIFTSVYPIPEEEECVDYLQYGWGSAAFSATPWGRAHQRMIANLTNRMEEVITGP